MNYYCERALFNLKKAATCCSQKIQEAVMGANNRAFIVLSVGVMLASPTSVTADRIDLFAQLVDKSDGREQLSELTKQLAPVKPRKDASTGRYYFEGRILKVIPPVKSLASNLDINHWLKLSFQNADYAPKIVFEAYGRGGTPKSRKVAIISTHQMRIYCHNTIDTVLDYSLMLSNRHEIMNVEFGSPSHRQAIFAALDPDGSMGLPGGGSQGNLSGLKEGALMIFGKQGKIQDTPKTYMQMQINPSDPIYYFSDNDPLRGLPYLLIYEYAKSMKYPGCEPAYGEMAKAALQIFYTLSLAEPDLTSPGFRSRAKRYNDLGRSTFSALFRAFYYSKPNVDMTLPNVDMKLTDDDMPLANEDVRRAVLDVLVDGPLVPTPYRSGHSGERQMSICGYLMLIIKKDKALAPLAQKVLERHLAPEPGEAADVTALYQLDRELCGAEVWHAMIPLRDDNESIHPAVYTLARVGWGEEKEMKDFVDALISYATDSRISKKVVQCNIDIMLIMAQPKKYTRKDRQEFGISAANELDKRIAEERRLGGRFIELWDASTTSNGVGQAKIP